MRSAATARPGDRPRRAGAHAATAPAAGRAEAARSVRDWKRWGVEAVRAPSMCVQAEDPRRQRRAASSSRGGSARFRERMAGARIAPPARPRSALWERFDRAPAPLPTRRAPPISPSSAPHAPPISTRKQARCSVELGGARSRHRLERPSDWRASGARRQRRRARVAHDRSTSTAVSRRGWLARYERRSDAQLRSAFGASAAERGARRKARASQSSSALAQSDQLAGAAARVRDAQARWAPAVSAPRKVEQALWTRVPRRAATPCTPTACGCAMRQPRSSARRRTRARRSAIASKRSPQDRSLPVDGDRDGAGRRRSRMRARMPRETAARVCAGAACNSAERMPQLSARFRDACARVPNARWRVGAKSLGRHGARGVCRPCAPVPRAGAPGAEQGAARGSPPSLEGAREAWLRLPRAERCGRGERSSDRFAAAAEAAGRRRPAREARAESGGADGGEASAVPALRDRRRRAVAGALRGAAPQLSRAMDAGCHAARVTGRARAARSWKKQRRIEARWHALGASPQSEDEMLRARYQAALAVLPPETSERGQLSCATPSCGCRPSVLRTAVLQDLGSAGARPWRARLADEGDDFARVTVSPTATRFLEL